MTLLFITSRCPEKTDDLTREEIRQLVASGHEINMFHLKGATRHASSRTERKEKDGESHLALVGLSSLPGVAWFALRHARYLLPIVQHIARHGLIGPNKWRATPRLLIQSVVVALEISKRDIVHVHAVSIGEPAAVAWIVSRMTDIPFSVSHHSSGVQVSGETLSEIIQDAMFVRVSSETAWEGIADELIATERGIVQLVRQGIPVSITESAEPLPLFKEAVRVLFAGDLRADNAPALFVQALNEIGENIEWAARIVGDGPKYTELRALALASVGPSGSISFDGSLTDEDLHNAFQWAHVVVVPKGSNAVAENEMPYAVLLALAHARVVIASDVGSVHEVIEDAKTGFLVDPGEPRQIADKISWIAQHWEQAAELGRRGRHRIAQDYDVGANCKKLAQLLGLQVEKTVETETEFEAKTRRSSS